MSALEPLFAPRSVAVLGVSRNPAKLGFRLLQNLQAHGYRGRVHPVNPSGERILEYQTVRDVQSLPEGIDLALVSLPAAAVPDAVRGLAARRARTAVVLSSGFGEVDAGGQERQRALLDVARSAGLRLVGPNCMGVYSAPARLNGTYFWDLPRLAGGIGVVSQSGAYGGLIFRHLGARGLGVSRFLSIGNQVDVDVAEVIDYLTDDAETTLIACFVEALRDGRRFVDVATRAVRAKPVVVLKGGRSAAGRRAAGSHTGSLAGAWEVYRAAFRHAGVVAVEDTEEFFDAIEALVLAAGRWPTAPAIAVITVSGGPSVVAADTAERAGLAVPALADSARETLRALLPPFAAVGNPVDLTPQVEPARIVEAVRLVLDQPAVAGAVAVNVGLDMPEFAEGLIGASTATGKPLVAFTADAPGITQRFVAGRVPVLPSPERAVRAWRALWLAGRGPVRGAARPVRLPPDVARALATVGGVLPYALARRALEAAGVPFCREITAASPDHAVAAAGVLGYPVVIKAAAPGLIHKTEAGGVRLGLDNPDRVRSVAEEMLRRLGAPAVLVQETVGPGVELLVGGRRDEVFGPLVAFGTGGILTEVIHDVSLCLVPLDAAAARAMLREGVRERLLAGPRGLPPVDDAPLIAAVLAVADLLVTAPRIVEIDVNPLVAAGAAAVAVDALIVLGEHD